MKKSFKLLASAMVLLTLAASVFADSKVVSGDEIKFPVSKNSVDAENTCLIIKYDRTAAGKDELISLKNVKLTVTVNGEVIPMPTTIDFALDEYASYFPGPRNANNMKEYKAKISMGRKVIKGDVVKVTLESATVDFIGANSEGANLGGVIISVIDVAPRVNYYLELCANKDEYKPLMTKGL